MDSFLANLKFFQDLLSANGFPVPDSEQYKSAFHLNMMDAIRYLTKSKSEEEIKKIWQMGRNRAVKYDVSLLKSPEGMSGTIEKLAKHYKLGIVTNRIKDTVYESPEVEKLKNYFKAVVSCEETTKHKPNPEPLWLAAERLGVNPNECVYVGDVENDAKAAKAAGMKAIIYSTTTIDLADACTSEFSKIPELIKRF